MPNHPLPDTLPTESQTQICRHAPAPAAGPPLWAQLMDQADPDQLPSGYALRRLQDLLADGAFTQARQLLKQLHATRPGPLLLRWLGLVARAAGDLPAARHWLQREQESLPIFAARTRAANAWLQAEIALAREDLVDAIAWLRTCLLQARFAHDPLYEARARQLLGELSSRRARPDLARDHYLAARAAYLKAGDSEAASHVSQLLAALPTDQTRA